jgi:L-2-hydroxyglutarate oxidase
MSDATFDIAVVGGGIVGLATAMLMGQQLRARIVLLEAEATLAAHQTGHNSGVLHSGLYYRPGSLKARNCVAGRSALLSFCAEQGIAHESCGKLVVATQPSQVEALERLAARGQQNGLSGLRRLSAVELAEYEPHVRGVGGLWVPQTGIVDFVQVAQAYGRVAQARGVEIRKSTPVRGVRRLTDSIVLQTARGEVVCRHLVNCGGLHSDRLARLAGMRFALQILPFRGEYYELIAERRSLVRNLIYPVPDARFPFLGVHFTRRIGGEVEAGPNAVLALARQGYRWRQISARDLAEMAAFRGSWRMARRYWRTGLTEVRRSLSKSRFLQDLQRLVPELRAADLRRAGAGVRAMAVGADGSLIDDFRIVQGERMIHVLNAPSPAATASLSIGQEIVDLARRSFGMGSVGAGSA